MSISYITFGVAPIWSADFDSDLQILLSPPENELLGDAILLHVLPDTEEKVADFLIALRGDEESFLKPVFLTGEVGKYIAELADGVGLDLDTIKAKVRIMRERKGKLASSVLRMGDDFRLLAYLYVHEKSLNAVPDSLSSYFYRYPLAEVFVSEGTSTIHWLEAMQRKQLLDADELIDHIKHCPECGGIQLNYLEVCKSCSSLRLQRKPFLRCIACGHAGVDEDFISDGYLSCPKCHVRLNRLGVDYDRALDSYICQDCAAQQVSLYVVARCMKCGCKSETQELTVQDIYSYKLSVRANSALLLGDLDALLTGINIMEFTRFDLFRGILEWQLKLLRRYPGEPFSLVGVRFPGLMDQINQQGVFHVVKLLDNFTKSMRDLVRETDLVSRSDQITLWLLLPKAGREGGAHILGRIRKYKDNIATGADHNLHLRFVQWFPEEGLPESADALLEMLSARLSV